MEILALATAILSLVAGLVSLSVSFMEYKEKKAQRSGKRRP